MLAHRTALPYLALLLGAMMTSSTIAQGEATTRGHLVIIGGGLRPDNAPVFASLVGFAGGPEKARFVILPTASYSSRDSHLFAKELQLYGVSADRVEVLDVTEHNASTSTSDAANLEKVRAATGVFLSGGDQRRLVKALQRKDGTDTPLLAEVRKLYARGGVIAGTSAGASAQSQTMLAVSGLPDRMIDEGYDALDFGITHDSRQRGLLLTKGFGFFESGIIDQHFFHFRGRLGRLTRAVDESKVPFGFGIEENTALIVEPSGRCRVQGAGMVTILKTNPQFPGVDGPLGYSIRNVWVSVLSEGDTFDPSTLEIKIAPEKPEQTLDKAEYNGNFLISDIGSGPSTQYAFINGLAENQKPHVDGVMLKYHHDWTHGYRFSISRQVNSPSHVGVMNSAWTYSILNLRLDIKPIAGGIHDSSQFAPVDLPANSQAADAIKAVVFRGLIVPDSQRKFRPEEAMTRGQMAATMARSAHLLRATSADVNIRDCEFSSPEGEEIYKAVARGFIGLDNQQRFRAEEKITSDHAAHALRKLASLDRDELEVALKADLDSLEQKGGGHVTRQEIAVLVARILRIGS